jgi:FMN phosphatase YigB (HAD superfamily)
VAKTVLITDLDNTLFDWVELWHRCFEAMLERLIEISGVKRETLIDEIRTVHQRHRTSEYAFLIEELPSLDAGMGSIAKYQPAIDAFRKTRRETLTLYPTVADTLLKLRGRGARLVGYTESLSFYSSYRVRRLGLDGIFEYIFSPPDHEIPSGIDLNKIRKYSASHYELKSTKHVHTPRGIFKPSKEVLHSIIGLLGVEASECVYVGDSLAKDVSMAQDAGIDDVWAKYGLSLDTPAYNLLRSVTYWSDADIEREKQILECGVRPTTTLNESFSELLLHYKFESENGNHV